MLACLLPGVIGAGLLFTYQYREGRAQLEKDTLQTARALVQAVDNQIFRVEALAHGLATSGFLARGDLAGFHAQARETLKRANLTATVVLVDRTGQQVLNALTEFGAPLPRAGNPALIRRVFETGEPVVSDVFTGAMVRRPLMTVAMPVILGGKVEYVLITPILAERFDAILAAQGLRSAWTASILDSTGTILAHTAGAVEFPGKKPVPEFLRRYLAADEGTTEAFFQDGVPVLSVFARSPVTRWGVGIGIPRDALEASLKNRLLQTAAGVVGLFVIGLGLAWFVGGKIARSFRALVAPAVALGAAGTVSRPSVEVKEAAEVARALDEAAGLLKERQAAILASEEKYRTLFSNMAEGFALGELIYDARGTPVGFRLLEANDAFFKESGLSRELLNRRSRTLLPGLEDYWLSACHTVVTTGKSVRLQNCHADTQRHYDLCAFRPSPGHFAVVFRDITDARRAQALLARDKAELERLVQERTSQLVQSQKMEAIGQLTGGVAHDFNNVLQGLGSCLFVLGRYVPEGAPRTLFDSAQQCIESGARLTKALLAFARRQTLVPESVDLQKLFTDMSPLLERTLGGLISVAFEVQPGASAVLVDRAQLESAILNLAINARDAMPSGGRLRLRTAMASVFSGQDGHPPELAPGHYVTIAVEDTGAGMSEATQARVFEPFFTTKAFGSGSGLGLAMVHGMTMQSGGAVAIASRLGCGTTVTLYLPPAVAARPEPPLASADPAEGEGRTVLLVDDNSFVRDALEMTLEGLGYRVLALSDGEAALELLRKTQGIDVLVTDYAMPGMNGAQLTREARRLIPCLPVLLITGYAENADGMEGVSVLHKPFKQEQLASRVAELLGARRPGSAGDDRGGRQPRAAQPEHKAS